MCGRYALGIRASFVRYQLEQQGMPVDDAPNDDVARETYNFPPGAYGLVYRADIPDSGLRDAEDQQDSANDGDPNANDNAETDDGDVDQAADNDKPASTSPSKPQPNPPKKSYPYQLKSMKWGLIPFWTKRPPDYPSMLRTINCRDDSLIEPRGMWNTMKQRKRCLVLAQGFYEWLKKGPKEKVPHFVKRKDGQLMLFAGLWDCVRYDAADDAEGEGEKEKLYTYTIITTNSNKQLNFLHDRMPVILDPNSEAMKIWLDPTRNKWSDELQSLLKPYEGELECYPVTQEVGKVGNNSPNFIIPVDSKENKKNIANFFDNAKKQQAQSPQKQKTISQSNDDRITKDHDSTENHAPIPIPSPSQGGTKRKLSTSDEGIHDSNDHDNKSRKLDNSSPVKQEANSPSKSVTPVRQDPNTKQSPGSATKTTGPRRTRNPTTNEGSTLKKASPVKSAADGSKRITNFFGKS